jgi:conjugative relaxase-like TrwC/TraI family protein
MLHGSKPLTVQQAQTYYAREYVQGDYYTGSTTESPGIWRGQGASDLGLEGAVERDRFHELLTGYSGATQLVAPEIGTGVHRAAWDFQVSPDKSVSLVALVGGDDRVVETHRIAAERAFAVLESVAQTRDPSRALVATGNLVAARFDHDASRSLDPQLHSHYVVFNMTRRPEDGAWRALESRSLFKVQSLATATYQAELARGLQALGYEVQVSARGYVRIAGISEEALQHFSKRRHEVLAEVDRQPGVKDPEKAALRTRRPKNHEIDREALRRAWVSAAQKLGIDFAALQREAAERLASSRHRPATDPTVQASRSVSWAIEHLSDRQAIFSSLQLEITALRHATGRGPGADEVRAALAAHAGVVRGTRDRLTTPEMRRIEGVNLELMHQAMATCRPPIVTGPWKVGDLSADQLRVARHILESQVQILAVEGKPGTGKTFTLSLVREVAERRGWTVRGFAVTTGAVEELRKVGIEATTLKSLDRQPISKAPRQLWIVDEAGLLSNRDARTLLLRAHAEGARTVLIGDRRQHHAIEAGKPFVDFQKAGLEGVRLDSIRRQKNPEILAAVELTSAGRAREAIDYLGRRGYVTEIRAAPQRHQAMTRAFLKAPHETLMIAPSHAERADLNHLARQALLREGRIAAQGLVIEVAVSKSLTSAQRADVRSYEVGNLVTFHRAAPTHHLATGEAARVVAIDPHRHTLRVERLRGGGCLEYDPSRLRGVDVARVERRALAPGDRIVFRKPYGSPVIANGSAARVTRIERDGTLEIRLDRRPEKPVVLDSRSGPLPIDYGYAVTSHAAQGRTVHTVLTTIDVQHSPELVNRQQLNVTLSRATHELRIFTNDRSALPAAVDRGAPKTSALELPLPERRPSRAPEQSLDPTGVTSQHRRHSERAAGGQRSAAHPDRERPAPRGPGSGGRGRADGALLARAPGTDGRADPGLQPRRRAVLSPDPARSPFCSPARGTSRGGGGGPEHAADPRRHGAKGRVSRGAAGSVPTRLRERLEGAYARWQVWRSEHDALTREHQALKVELARLHTRAPSGTTPNALPTAVARLAVVKSRLAALTRARNPEELLQRTVRQIGVSRALSLLPHGAAAPVLALRIGTRVLTSLVRDR